MNDANKSNKLVSFTYGDAERIGMVVKKSERERRGRKPSSLPRAAGSGGGGGGEIIKATFLGVWQKGQGKNVDVPAGGQFTAATTIYVVNHLNTVPPAVYQSTARVCYIYLQDAESSSWHLLNASV